MWQQIIHTWNGAGFFLPISWMDSDSLELYTDASGTLGYGGILGNRWFQGQWETRHQLNAPGISIAWQELFALVVACHLWGGEFANKRIVFYSDNESVVNIVNSKRSHIARAMDLVRHLTFVTLRYNFYPRAKHIEGKKNEIADSISRFKMDRFRRLAPHADLVPCPVPPALLLNADIQNYFSLSVAASTKQTYTSSEKRFLEFCAFNSPQKSTHLPTDEETLIQYAAYLAKTIKHSSIKGYLAAVRHLHIRSGYELDLKKFLRLQLICR